MTCMIPLQSLIQRKVVVISHFSTIKEAARAMCDNQIGCALVSGPDGNAGGILTDRDLACYWGAETPLADRTVDEIVSRELIAASENAGLNDITRLMEAHGVRRIPIISTSSTGIKRFVGIVTLDDLVAAELVQPSQLARIIRRQVGRRIMSLERPYPGHVATARTEARSEAHKAQTLQKFHSHLVGATGLSKDLLPQVAHYILGSLVMRVSVTSGAHFIAQLPEVIREQLLNLPPGPDKYISSRTIIEELVSRFHLTESYARTVLNRLISALSTWVSPGQLEHFQAQLPEDFLPYFQKLPENQPLAAKLLSVTSPAFSEGHEIPRRYTGDGQNRSPQIAWSRVPTGTKEFALICEDLNSQGTTPWVHWVVYGISGAVSQLPEGLPQVPELRAPILARQGKTTGGSYGYEGPLPTEKDTWHRYRFHIYALDREITLPPGATAEELREQMKGHILADGILLGRYRRAQEVAA